MIVRQQPQRRPKGRIQSAVGQEAAQGLFPRRSEGAEPVAGQRGSEAAALHLVPGQQHGVCVPGQRKGLNLRRGQGDFPETAGQRKRHRAVGPVR